MEIIKTDFRSADIGEKDITMLAYAEKLTTAPVTVKKDDVSELKKAGFKEAQILDIAQVTAYYAFVNRLASGLGVELESYWEDKSGPTDPFSDG